MSAALPTEVLAFLRLHVHSVEQLEILLLLFADAARKWSANDVSIEMRSAPASASARLAELAKNGVLHHDEALGVFAYRSSESQDATVALVAANYAQRRHVVIEAIFVRPKGSMEMFAEAFRFRRKRDDDDDG